MMMMTMKTKMMTIMTWGDDDDDDDDKDDDNDDVREIFSLSDHSFTVVPCQRHFRLVWIVIWMMMIKMMAMVMMLMIMIMTGMYKEQLTMNWNSPLVFYSRIWDEFISCLGKKGRYGDFVSLIFQPSSPSPSSLLSSSPSSPCVLPPDRRGICRGLISRDEAQQLLLKHFRQCLPGNHDDDDDDDSDDDGGDEEDDDDHGGDW